MEKKVGNFEFPFKITGFGAIKRVKRNIFKGVGKGHGYNRGSDLAGVYRLDPLADPVPPIGVAAALLGGFFLGCSVAFWRSRETRAARRLMLASVAYLPILLIIMVLDRVA